MKALVIELCSVYNGTFYLILIFSVIYNVAMIQHFLSYFVIKRYLSAYFITLQSRYLNFNTFCYILNLSVIYYFAVIFDFL